MAVFVPIEKLDLDYMREVLQTHIDDEFSAGESSQFIKIVCVFDYASYSRLTEGHE
jgi:hypothetical protein